MRDAIPGCPYCGFRCKKCTPIWCDFWMVRLFANRRVKCDTTLEAHNSPHVIPYEPKQPTSDNMLSLSGCDHFWQPHDVYGENCTKCGEHRT